MKGYVLDGIRKVALREFPDPECGPDQVVIKNRMSAICGGDINSYQFGGADNYMPDGEEFGHEMVSTVVAVGDEVEGVSVGDRVYPYPMTTKQNPRKSACLGGFSEYVLVEKAALGYNLFPVPETLSDKEAALIEPFTIGFRAAEVTDCKPGENALVYGGGCIGISAAIRYKEDGAEKVAVVERSRLRCDIIDGLGIKAVCTLDDDWKQQLIEYFGQSYGVNGPAPAVQNVLDAAGSVELAQDAQGLIPYFARISIVGVFHKPCPVDLRALTYGQYTVRGIGGYTPDTVRHVMDVMASKRYDVESIATNVFPHDEFPQAIELACDTDAALKVLVDYGA